MPGLFGDTPNDVLAARRAERLQRIQILGNAPIGTASGVTAGGLLAEGLTGGDPRLRQAQALQEAQRLADIAARQQVAQVGMRPVVNAHEADLQEPAARRCFSLKNTRAVRHAGRHRLLA